MPRTQISLRAGSSHQHIPATACNEAPLKEDELKCYKCGQKGHIKPQCPKFKSMGSFARAQINDVVNEDNPTDSPLGDASNNVHCGGKIVLKSRVLLCLLSITCCGCLSLDSVVMGRILMCPPSVDKSDIKQFAVHMLILSAFSSHSFQCSFFAGQIRLVYALCLRQCSQWLGCCVSLLTLFAVFAVHLMLDHAWESSFIHHLFTYREGEENGTVTATVVLIAVTRLVSLGLKSSSIRSSVGVGRLAS